MSTETMTHHDSGSNKVFGFWIYLMSDCILFAIIFATYAVLMNGVADGPSAKQIFQLPYVLIETFCLLISSFTYGLAVIAMQQGNITEVIRRLALTFVFGLAFIVLELNEFYHLIVAGYGPTTSAFLSAYFTLVGTHGLHVTIGLIWMIVLITQISHKGLTSVNNTRIMCLSLFWHFLDVIWICVFSVVYLLGVV